MNLNIALAGNPNSGKTTLFNALTGSHQFVGNWPGVTVEKKEGKYKDDKNISIIDLPGIYSLSPYTLEEVVSRTFLLTEKVDVILNIVDGSNIERNLYLTTQLLELGIPTVVAINMLDIVEKRNDKIDFAKLSALLGCEVVGISALRNKNIEDLMHAVERARHKAFRPIQVFDGSLLKTLNMIQDRLPSHIPAKQKMFYAVKMYERDAKLIDISFPNVESFIVASEKAFDDDCESIITNARYNYITDLVSKCYVRGQKGLLSTSDKIDKILTNRILALPIFALIMWLVYYISVSTVGTLVTDWTNDVLFGEIIPPMIENFLVAVECADWLQSLILDGIVAGVGAVIGFVPQMFVLFGFLAILEDCGYMARIAFIMDRLFCKFGLSGKSFIPILIGTGCGVPGIMASRTIESEKDRRMTIITTTFIPCSAKLPIIALIAGAFFGGASWVAPSAYFLGIGAIIVSGIILKKTKLFVGDPAPFVMELPAYHMPVATNVLRNMWDRGFSFVKKAGSVVLLSTILIWFTTSFGFVQGSFTMVDDINCSVMAIIGKSFAWFFAPLGFGTWQSAIATIMGLVAKENVVATLGQLYGYAEVAEDGMEFWAMLATDFTVISAYAFMCFNLLCAPCFAAIGAIKREMNNWKWTLFAIFYQCGFAYVIAFIIYQLGTTFTTGTFNIMTIIAMLASIGLVFLMLKKPSKATSEFEYAVK